MPDAPAPGVLHVDLTDGTVEREEIPSGWMTAYVGGKGLGARYLYERLDPGTDPLAPGNALLFMVGPLTGYLPGDQRWAAVTRSPLTGAVLDSYGGGAFAGDLARSLGPLSGVAVTGRAPDPRVLVVENGEGRLRPAGDLWGRDVAATTAALEGSVAAVGPAGENRVHYATVATGGGAHHAGRGGAGAVMGAKGLKAVVARAGDSEPPAELVRLRAEYERRYREDERGRWHAAGGTVESVDFADEAGLLATRGWQAGRFEGADDVGVEAVREAADSRERDGAVPGDFRLDAGGDDQVPRGALGMSLGAGLGIDDFDAVAALGETCDRLGLDVISAGTAVAWAIRATDEGVLAVDRELSFGDPAAAESVLRAIATREEGLGDALADGVDAAADRVGGTDLVPTVKAMAAPGYDPRASPATALAYATSDRGACHRRSLPAEAEAFRGETWNDADRVDLVVAEQTTSSVLWSLVADDFAGVALRADLGAEWLETVDAPAPTDPGDLARAGERIWTLTRLFNVREGFDATDDRLPAAFTRPLEGGPACGRSIDRERFRSLRRRYYAARGWSSGGIPTRALLRRLDLLDVVDDATPVANDPADPPSGVAAPERSGVGTDN
jgi:aldehyde:ferredoxin oxidoreductase